ncbi:hypothetical protein BH09BAC5_BH09BAC5_22840 [soil metagenome]
MNGAFVVLVNRQSKRYICSAQNHKYEKITSFRLVAVIFAGLTSFVSENAALNIKVSKGKVKIGKQYVVPNWSLSGFEKVLGKSGRERDGYNKTHTYDNYSLVLFEKSVDKVASGTVTEFQIYFKVDESNEVTPNGNGFNGNLMVDKLKIDASLSASKMLSKLSKWKKTDSYIEHSYRMASNGLYIYFQFNDAETALLKISIGPDKTTAK